MVEITWESHRDILMNMNKNISLLVMLHPQIVEERILPFFKAVVELAKGAIS